MLAFYKKRKTLFQRRVFHKTTAAAKLDHYPDISGRII